MCGISGHISLTQKSPKVQAMRKMLSILKHRGPSGQGEWVQGSVAMGMRRLSIIDVSGGDQPLFNERKTIAIIGNGEIYNYKELQSQLQKRGHKLRTGSDIETIVHLYEDEGVDCLKKLRGMFAICLHDTKNHTVLLARDRIGEKPLYYTKTEDGIIFSSEMKSILSFPKVIKKIRHESVQSFFSFFSIPEPYTAIEGIYKLQAGSYMRIDTKTGSIQTDQYWNENDIQTNQTDNPTKAIEKVLDEIGKISLRSDVPVGISLSGGFDSATVLALATRHSDKLKAFSVGYEHTPKTDERKKAKELAQLFKVPFYEKEITTSEMVKDFPMTIYYSDDPISDIASYSIYAVAKLAREHKVPVLLGGVGGDELFWGYPWMQKAGKTFAHSQGENVQLFDSTLGYKIGKLFLSIVGTKKQLAHHANKNLFFWTHDHTIKSKSDYGRMAIFGVKNAWLQTDCLALGDRMSMAASVELRLPLVDYKLFETVLEHKMTVEAYTQESKRYLKQAMKGKLPEELFNRKKQGFTPPVASWLSEILQTYLHLLDGGFLVSEGILKRSMIKILRHTWRLLPFVWYHLYTALVLEVWCRVYIRNEDAATLSTTP